MAQADPPVLPEEITDATSDSSPGAPAAVVVGFDGSADATDAVLVAAREAQLRGLGLEVLLALPPLGRRSAPELHGLDEQAVLRVAADVALDAVLGTVRRRSPGVRVGARIVDGTPLDVLRSAARTSPLVVLGTTSVRSSADLLLGSTVAGLVRLGSSPLLVVPRRPDQHVTGRRGVVVGVDGSREAAGVLAAGARAAQLRHARLCLVHVWQRPMPGFDRLVVGRSVGDAPRQHRAENWLDDLVAITQGDAAGPDGSDDPAGRVLGDTDRVVRRGHPAQTLLAAATTAELLVVGHRRRGLTDAIGSVATAVLHRADCPVLVVPVGR